MRSLEPWGGQSKTTTSKSCTTLKNKLCFQRKKMACFRYHWCRQQAQMVSKSKTIAIAGSMEWSPNVLRCRKEAKLTTIVLWLSITQISSHRRASSLEFQRATAEWLWHKSLSSWNLVKRLIWSHYSSLRLSLFVQIQSKASIKETSTRCVMSISTSISKASRLLI